MPRLTKYRTQTTSEILNLVEALRQEDDLVEELAQRLERETKPNWLSPALHKFRATPKPQGAKR